MWKRKLKNRVTNYWTADLWTEVVGRQPHHVGLLIEGYKFTSDTNHVSREYFGRLFFKSPHPATGVRVSLSFVTDPQQDHEGRVTGWWHWGSAQIPREEVYGIAWQAHFSEAHKGPNAVLSVRLGTDEQGELQFEKLVERAALLNLGPVSVHIWMTALPRAEKAMDEPIMLISRYIIEQTVEARDI